jgi:hypothetical protein
MVLWGRWRQCILYYIIHRHQLLYTTVITDTNVTAAAAAATTVLYYWINLWIHHSDSIVYLSTCDAHQTDTCQSFNTVWRLLGKHENPLTPQSFYNDFKRICVRVCGFPRWYISFSNCRRWKNHRWRRMGHDSVKIVDVRCDVQLDS